MNIPRSGTPGFLASSSQSRGLGGRIPSPSCQTSVTGGRAPRAGKRKVTRAVRGVRTALTSSTWASTDEGEPRSRAQKGASRVWQAQSPSIPQPKSHQPRQRTGAIDSW